MLRYTKLTVEDEIENALSYYHATFLRQIPRLYREIEDALPGHTIAPFFRMGNWIGGDRDGNPNVGADTLQMALARQCENGAALLPDRVARTRRRTVDLGDAGARHARDARAGPKARPTTARTARTNRTGAR